MDRINDDHLGEEKGLKWIRSEEDVIIRVCSRVEIQWENTPH